MKDKLLALLNAKNAEKTALAQRADCYCPGLDIIEFARIAWQVFGIAVRVYPSQEFAHLELSDLGGVYNQETGAFLY